MPEAGSSAAAVAARALRGGRWRCKDAGKARPDRQLRDAAARAVRLLDLADKEALNQSRRGILLRAPGAGNGDGRNDGIGTHSEPADGGRMQLMFLEQIEDSEASEASAFSVQRRGAAVDVVVRLRAGRQGEIAEAEGSAGEQIEQGSAGIQGVHLG